MYPIASATGNGNSALYFNSIPQTFAHLQIRVFGRSNAAGSTQAALYTNMNAGGFTNANHYLYGTGSSAVSANNTGLPYLYFGSVFPGAASAANIYGCVIIDILDYTNTNKNKVFRVTAGNDQNGSGVVQLGSGLIISTAAITSTFIDTEGNLTTGSRVDLYGISTSGVTGA
jgi:hypothetical protein